jgi:hypothetical protein
MPEDEEITGEQDVQQDNQGESGGDLSGTTDTNENAPITGDVNSDGVVDAADAAALMGVLTGRAEETAAADVNTDGEINSEDMAALTELLAEQDEDNPWQSVILDDWILWEKLLSLGKATGIDARTLAIEQAIEAFVSGMTEDPAYQGDARVNGSKTPIIASRTSTYECTIKAAPGTNLHVGDLVECFNEMWLVMELYTDKVGILNGKMWVCNDIVNFQNNSEPIITQYCIIDDGSYSKKTSDPIAYVPPNTYTLYLSMNEDTTKLYIDKRLSFGVIYAPDGLEILEVYKVVGIDLKSRNFGEGSHLMVLTMQRDVYNATTDSIVQNLCDVYVAPGDVPEPQPTGSCVIKGKDAIRIGTSRTYYAVFTDAEGNVVSGVTPVWMIGLPTGSGITYATNVDYSFTITVPLDEALIGTGLRLHANAPSQSAYGKYEKKVQVIGVG